jgi:hypothetical protein
MAEMFIDVYQHCVYSHVKWEYQSKVIARAIPNQ